MTPLLLLVSLLPAGPAPQPDAYSVASPDGGNRVTITTAGGLRWSVTRRGADVLLPSPLVLELQGAPPLGPDVTLLGAERRRIDATWRPVCGKRSLVRDRAAELTLHLQE